MIQKNINIPIHRVECLCNCFLSNNCIPKVMINPGPMRIILASIVQIITDRNEYPDANALNTYTFSGTPPSTSNGLYGKPDPLTN